MSRALLLIAQVRFLKRPLTPEETEEYLNVWRSLAGEKVIRIPKGRKDESATMAKIDELHAQQKSIREISEAVKWKRSRVHRYLSRKSAIPSGQTSE